MQTQKSHFQNCPWAHDAVYHFMESYLRATDIVNKLFNIKEENLSRWVQYETRRWRDYKKVCKYVDNCLAYESGYGKYLTNVEWKKRILILLGKKYG